MVVFTCNNCGDSIQKPKVEKHIGMECKKKFMNASLCCIDCLKDFNRTSYNDHTKCVTELERYSGKGFVPKPSSNKGERKQQSWLEVIQGVLEKPNLSKQQRNLLVALSGLSNVPRKKPKFINFVKQSLKHLKALPAVINEVFELIENEFKSIQATNTANQEPQENDKKQVPKNEIEKVKNSDLTQTENETKKKKKKNKTLESETNEIATESQKDNTAALDQSGAFELVQKKKKKKKERADGENQPINIEKKNSVNINENGKRPLENSFEEEIPVKSVSKKRQKKMKFQDLENSVTESQNSSAVEPNLNGTASEEPATKSFENNTEKLSKKEKKKKSKELQKSQNSTTNGTVAESPAIENCHIPDKTENSEKLGKKDKKKKSKLQENLNDSTSEAAVLENVNISVENESTEKLSKKEKKKKLKQPENGEIQNITSEPELNGTTVETPSAENADIPNNEDANFDNLSKKERKELKKRLKYEAQLKAVESEANQIEQNVTNNQENENTNPKPEKKKKRKLVESNENEEIVSKKSKVSPIETVVEEAEPAKIDNKFSWDGVIKTVLEKAEGNEVSLKKLSKKVIDEYIWYHPNQKSYEDVIKKFNKKIVKLPFVKILKEKAKLCA